MYVHTCRNVLISINPTVRIPRTFRRFCGLMVQLLQKLSIRATNGPDKLMKVRTGMGDGQWGTAIPRRGDHHHHRCTFPAFPLFLSLLSSPRPRWSPLLSPTTQPIIHPRSHLSMCPFVHSFIQSFIPTIQQSIAISRCVQVIKSPVTKYFPLDCRRVGFSVRAKLEPIQAWVDKIDDAKPLVFVVGQ